MESQVLIHLSKEEKDLIINASKLVGLGHSSFMRSISLERARDILQKNK